MNSKKITKIISTVLIVFMVIATVMPVFAAQDPSKYNGTSNAKVDKIENFGQTVIKIVTTVGSIASVVVLVVLGIKYMMGSAEEKAEYKKTLLPYIIGAVFVFTASTIASVIFNFANSNLVS